MDRPTTPAPNIIELALQYGASSYRNRSDTAHPEYGYTEQGLLRIPHTSLLVQLQQLFQGLQLFVVSNTASSIDRPLLVFKSRGTKLMDVALKTLKGHVTHTFFRGQNERPIQILNLSPERGYKCNIDRVRQIEWVESLELFHDTLTCDRVSLPVRFSISNRAYRI